MIMKVARDVLGLRASMRIVLVIAYVFAACLPDTVALESNCDGALGIESGAIKDAQITGRSHGPSYLPHFARLGNDSYWYGDGDKWGLQIDLINITTITKIALQGQDWYRTSKFAIHYSFDGVVWLEYRSSQYNGKDAQPLPGVERIGETANYTFIPTFEARFVVVQPKAYRYRPMIRMELYGCPSATAPYSEYTRVKTDIVHPQQWTFQNSPYIIDNTVTVGAIATLTIFPGTAVIFTNPKAGLVIKGRLEALGSSSQEVSFMSGKPSLIRKSEWAGIQKSDGFIVLRHAVVKNAAIGLNSIVSRTVIEDSTFINNQNSIEPLGGASNSSHVFMFNTHIINSYYGIYIPASSMAFDNFWVSRCAFSGNRYGFYMDDVGHASLRFDQTLFTSNGWGLEVYSIASFINFYGSGLIFKGNKERNIRYRYYGRRIVIPGRNCLFLLNNSTFNESRTTSVYIYYNVRYANNFTIHVANNTFDGGSYGVYSDFGIERRRGSIFDVKISNNTFQSTYQQSVYLDYAQSVDSRASFEIDKNLFRKSRKAMYIFAKLANRDGKATIQDNIFSEISHGTATLLDMDIPVDFLRNKLINCTVSESVLEITKNGENFTLTDNLFSNPGISNNLRVYVRTFGQITRINACYNYWGYQRIDDIRGSIDDFYKDTTKSIADVYPWYTTANLDILSNDMDAFDPEAPCLGGPLTSDVTLVGHSAYNICRSIFVPQGFSLTVGEASQLNFNTKTGIGVHGTLQFLNSVSRRTVLRSMVAGTRTKWGGIMTYNSGLHVVGVELMNVREALLLEIDKPVESINFSFTNITIRDAQRGIILKGNAKNTSVTIADSSFISCSDRGVHVNFGEHTGNFIFRINQSKFMQNEIHAIYIKHRSVSSSYITISMKSLLINGTTRGIYVDTRGVLTGYLLENSNFTSLYSGNFVDLYLSPKSVLIRDNDFRNARSSLRLEVNDDAGTGTCNEGIVIDENRFSMGRRNKYVDLLVRTKFRKYRKCSVGVRNNRFIGADIVSNRKAAEIDISSGERLDIEKNYLQDCANGFNINIRQGKSTDPTNKENQRVETVFIKYNNFINNTGRVLTVSNEKFRLNYNVFNNPHADYNVALTGGTYTAAVNASFNFWGTTDKKDIRSKILDYSINNNLPRVEFEPYMSGDNLTDIFVGITPFISPDGEIGGELIGNATLTLANSPYHAVAPIIIAKGAELTVEAGVVIECDENVIINVYGQLNCLGEKDLPVVFKESGLKPWIGISIKTEHLMTGIRLRDGPDPSVGRLEVRVKDVWGTVCSKGFDMVDARVACKQAGYFGFNAVIYTLRPFRIDDETVPVILDGVVCDGSESSLEDCDHNLYGSSRCEHSEDVVIDCNIEPITAARLTGSGVASLGRLEIRVNGTWGTVCDDAFGADDAIVACRHAGFTGTRVQVLNLDKFPLRNRSMPVWLSDLACLGSESNLNGCPHSGYGLLYCGHYEDVQLSCDSRIVGIRLAGGPRMSKGRLEVSVGGLWGTVCSNGFGMKEAKVVCHQLGFDNTNVTVLETNSYPVLTRNVYIILDDLKCSETDKSFSDCRHRGLFNPHGSCGHTKDVNIDCNTDAVKNTTTEISDDVTPLPTPSGRLSKQDDPRLHKRRRRSSSDLTSRLVNVLVNGTQKGITITGIIPHMENVTSAHSTANGIFIDVEIFAPPTIWTNISVYDTKREGFVVKFHQRGDSDFTISGLNIVRTQHFCLHTVGSGALNIKYAEIKECRYTAIYSNKFLKGKWQLSHSEISNVYWYFVYLDGGSLRGDLSIYIDGVQFHNRLKDSSYHHYRRSVLYFDSMYGERYRVNYHIHNCNFNHLDEMIAIYCKNCFTGNSLGYFEIVNNTFTDFSQAPVVQLYKSYRYFFLNAKLMGNVFRNNFDKASGKTSTVSLVYERITGHDGALTLSNNIFSNNTAHTIFEATGKVIRQATGVISRNKFLANQAVAVFRMEIMGVTIRENVFVNPDSKFELSVPLVSKDELLASFIVDARRNYWGVSDATEVNNRIAGFQLDIRRGVVYREPFYLGDDLMTLGNISAFIEGDSVGGLVDRDTVIPARPRPYTVDRSILVSHGHRLRIEGATLNFLAKRGILIEGDADIVRSNLSNRDASPWHGVVFTQRAWYKQFVSLERGSTVNEGLVVLKQGQHSGYICSLNFGIQEAQVVCRMLGYNFRNSQVVENAHSVYGATDSVTWKYRYYCNGDEKSLFHCSYEVRWCLPHYVAGIKCHNISAQRTMSNNSQLIQSQISGASIGVFLLSGYVNISAMTIRNCSNYGFLVRTGGYHELDLHGSRVTECQGEGIHVKAQNGLFLKSVIVDSSKNGINILRDNGSIHVSDVKVSGNTGKGLWIGQPKVAMPSRVTIENSVFEHHVRDSGAVVAEFCHSGSGSNKADCRLVVTNNIFRNNSGEALKIYTGSTYDSSRSPSSAVVRPVVMTIEFNKFDDCSATSMHSHLVTELRVENNDFIGRPECSRRVMDRCLLNVSSGVSQDSRFAITENNFNNLSGRCVVELESSTNGRFGSFQFNQLRNNNMLFEVLKVSSVSFNITDNIFDNPASHYEIHVYVSSKDNINTINNWFGSKNLSTVERRLYHKNDNKNRARLLYVPIMETPTYDCSGVANCSNNGECVRRNRCRCNYGYKGVLCNEFDCSDRMDCNDHGRCTAPQTCSCIAEWRGRDCIEPVCDGLNDCWENVGRGFCVAPNKCQCGRKYSGDDCSGCAINNWGPLCLPCPVCVNGVCDKNTGECICSSNNWRGTLCNRCAEKFYGPRCLPLPKILDIVPSSGPDIGGKLVNIKGHNFEPTANNTYYCRFSCCTKVKGVRLSDEHIQCVTPKLTASNYYVDVSPDGVHNFTNSELHYTFYARCPKKACGSDKKPPHGLCTFGQCVCYRPWTGDDCELELLGPIIIRPPNVTLLEWSMYSLQVNLTQGNATLYWSMTPRLLGLTFDSSNGLIEWQSAIASATPYTFTVRVSNNIGSDVASWTVTVPLSYSAIIDNISPSGVLPSPKSVLVTGHVVFVDPSNTAKVVAVTVKVSNKGRVRNSKVQTESLSNGEFVTWVHPLSSDAGVVLLGAHHPADHTFRPQKSWSVRRMVTNPRYSVSFSAHLLDRNNITIPSIATLINAGVDDIFNVTSKVRGISGPLTSVHIIEANSRITDSNMFIAKLSAGQQVPFDLFLTITGPFSFFVIVTFSSSQGTHATLTVYLSFTVRKPRLVLDPGSIGGNILIGSQKSYDIIVKNVGLVRANDVKVSLPIDSHFSISSFSKTNSTGSRLTLDPDEEATLTMTVTVNRGEPLGEFRGSIAIVSLTGGVSLGYHFFIVSDNKVKLIVKAEDEFTYFASNKPPLANATIRLWSRNRGIDLSYITNKSGIVVFENIFEDMYSLSGSAEGHGSKQKTILVTDDPKHTFVRLFLTRIAVKYTFTVTQTTFEDKYAISVTSTFETQSLRQCQVPMPVVTIKPNVVNLLPYEEGLDRMEFEVTNHGLLRANNLRFLLPTNHPTLIFNLIGDRSRDLEANTTIIIHIGVSIREVTKRSICGYACSLKMLYEYVCDDIVVRSDSVSFFLKIPGQPPRPCQSAGRYCPGDSEPGGWSSRGSITLYKAVMPITCRCIISYILDCVLAFTPLGCPIAIFKFPLSGDTIAMKAADILMACGGKYIAPTFGPPYTAIRCLMSIQQNCPRGFRSRRAINSAVVEAAIASAVPVDNFVKLSEEVFGGKEIFFTRDKAWFTIFKGAVSDDSDAEQIITDSEHRRIMVTVKPTDVEAISRFLIRWNNTMVAWNSGRTPAPGANVMSRSFLQARYARFVEDDRAAKKAGHDSIFAHFDQAVATYLRHKAKEGSKQEEGVCAKVRVRIIQDLVLTRRAFNARLEIENGETSILENIKVTLSIQDSLKPGINANHLFAIAEPKLVGITAVNGTGLLAKSVSGLADWLMAPYPDSARSVDVLYQVGGRLSYHVGGSNFSVSLLPDTITVKPTPSLEVRYYHQKYVFGDDAMTKDIIEPIEPFFLAMTIANVGYGTARSVRITSAQPEIIENEKGLLITFEIIGSQLGNKPATKSLKMNFGDIEASETKAAKWILTSTLSGKFYNLTATFENINPFGDPELSILDVLEYHELFQLVFIEGEDDLDDFLVNDVIDEFVPQVPDRLCSSYNGSLCYDVSHTFVSSKHPLTSQSSGRYVTVTVVVETADSGWMYTRVEDDPVIINALASDRRLLVVNRTVDGKTLLVGKNAWVTTRVEDKVLFHMLDYLPGGLQRNNGSMQSNLTTYQILFGPSFTTTSTRTTLTTFTNPTTTTTPTTPSTPTTTPTTTKTTPTTTTTTPTTTTTTPTTTTTTPTTTATTPTTTKTTPTTTKTTPTTTTTTPTTTTTTPTTTTTTPTTTTTTPTTTTTTPTTTTTTHTTLTTTPTTTTTTPTTPTTTPTIPTTSPSTTTTPDDTSITQLTTSTISTSTKTTQPTTPSTSTVIRIQPTSGSNRGGEIIHVIGRLFVATQNSSYFCRFGSKIIQGTRISSERIRCMTPSMDPGFEGSVDVEVSPNGVENFTFNQVTYKFIRPCATSSCGSQFTPARGACKFGVCHCEGMWSGDACDIQMAPSLTVNSFSVSRTDDHIHTTSISLLQTQKSVNRTGSVRVRTDQHLVMLRRAFHAKLELGNSGDGRVDDILVTMEIRNFTAPHTATTQLFYIGVATLNGLNAVNGTGSLKEGRSASADWLLIPYTDQSTDASYVIGGRLSYNAGSGYISVYLPPIIVTVQPTPFLRLNYFFPLYVFNSKVHPTKGAQVDEYKLTVLVLNEGQRSARDVRITSGQPTASEMGNEISADLMITGVRIANETESGGLMIDFGDVAPGAAITADWFIRTEVSAQFDELLAKVMPEGDSSLTVPSYKGRQLVTATYHELFRVVKIPGDDDDDHDAFLVNDLIDGENPPIPDRLYRTFRTDSVRQAFVSRLKPVTSLDVSVAKKKYLFVYVTVTVTHSDWFYARVEHDKFTVGDGTMYLQHVKREHDAMWISSRNAWITRRWDNRVLFHLLDRLDASKPSDEIKYVVLFGPDHVSGSRSLIGSLMIVLPLFILAFIFKV